MSAAHLRTSHRPNPLARSIARRGRALARHMLLLALVVPGAVLFLAPWAWMVSMAGKDSSLIWRMPPVWIPPTYHWENFVKAWQTGEFALYYRNSALICTMNVIGIVLACSLAAYAFARLRFPGRDLLFIVVLSTMMLPGQVTLIPLYVLFSRLGWVNTFRPLIVPVFFGDAFHTFLLRQFFLSLSTELDDAARIDGCSRFGVFFRILLPLVKPAMAVTAIGTFTWAWNDFMGPLIYLNSPQLFTVTVGLNAAFSSRFTINLQYLMAMTAVSTLVPVTAFFATQRYLIQGVVITGIKG